MDSFHPFKGGEVIFTNSEETPDDREYRRMLERTCRRILTKGSTPEEKSIITVVKDTMDEAKYGSLDRDQAHGLAQMNVQSWNMGCPGEPLVGKDADLVLVMVDYLYNRERVN